MQAVTESDGGDTVATQSAEPDQSTGRRAFLERVTVGAAAFAAASMATAMPLSALGESGMRSALGERGPWNETWLDKITGKHKQFFDAATTNEGFPLVFAMAFLNLYHEAYGLTDHDLAAVVGLRHFGMPMGVTDAIWAKYKIGDTFKIMDPATKAPATRNPFLHPDGVPFPGAEIPTLVGRGVIFTVCNVALTVLSGKLAANAGVTADVAKQEWTAGIVPGAVIVPVGVLAVNRAQEKGCTYCYGGG
jgi:intracellular sulfur oxidation DsrE/DsrF family protein